MRRLLTFECAGEVLGASLDEGRHTVAVLIVTGGSQTRIGSHRLFERLSAGLASAGYGSLRFDRRGVGDSSGPDPGFRGSGPDIATAAELVRVEQPGTDQIVGLGLCDGATALALHASSGGLNALILINPWLVEAEADAPPPAAIKRHYRKRLLSLEGWKKIATGSVSYRKLFLGISKIARDRGGSPLAQEVGDSLRRQPRPTALILSRGDATAIGAAAELKAKAFAGLIHWTREIDTDSHTFAKPGDEKALLATVLEALSALAADNPR